MIHAMSVLLIHQQNFGIQKMPRTLDHIVACHDAARALASAGRPIWSKRVRFRSVLREDPSNETPEHVAYVSVRIAGLLRAQLPKGMFQVDHPDYESDLCETVEAMADCTVDGLKQDAENGFRAVDMLNGWLEYIYDWADCGRVWVD